jgi:hypothetical protein
VPIVSPLYDRNGTTAHDLEKPMAGATSPTDNPGHR